MDQWVTDGFYSHFPSYSQQPTRREALAKARQLDYQTFLSRISPTKIKADGKGQKRHTPNDNNTKRQKIPSNDVPNDKLPKLDTKSIDDTDTNGESDASCRVEIKNRFLDELEKMDLPDIINEQSIKKRNQKLKEEKRLNNLRYQQELLEQIEQKRRDREKQKAKEQEEEEKLTKRMEEQLKLVRVHDEIENQRQTRQREKSRIPLELNRPMVNQQSTKPPTTVRSEQLDINTSRVYDERKAQTDRGKENLNELKRNDKEIYNFFTNSAHNQLKDTRYSHYFDLEDVSENDTLPNSMSSFTYNTYPTKSNRHQDVVHKQSHSDPQQQQPICNFCKHNRFLARSQEENIANGYICGSCENEPICLSCRKEICVRCKKPTHNDDHVAKMPLQRCIKQRNTDSDFIVAKKPEIQPKSKYVRLDNYQPIYTDEDDSLSDLSSSDHKPYSFNIDQSSLFHPSKSRLSRKLSVNVRNGEVSVKPEDSFDELKRITNEKILKYSMNYGDFLRKKTNESKMGRVQETRFPMPILKPTSNPDPMPVMKQNTKDLIEFAKELERGDHNIFRRTETKYQVPAVQTNKVVQNNNTSSTLTQVGAFKKQLLLDKLNF
ncbi:uncharacterized protein LOC116343897 [Contarinia nasturtii]|uniref:uncharacterized protein LOC116343897 n=1 Tax=Contarinia nasturtii TaxID=265458 RepID=UPI0012D3CABC|nr:uncharacterized protein LOC116343897 [Contarinia nasturtii]